MADGEPNIAWVDVALSSRATRIGYDAESQTLYVQWAKGKTSAYSGVPPDIAEEAGRSWSVGQYFNEKVIGQYSMTYV